MDTPHYPLTFTTLVITSLHITLSYFQPVFAHEVDHIFFLQLRAKTFLQRLSLWPLFFWAKMTFLYKIKNYLLNATLVTSTLLIMACLFLKNYEMLSSLYVKYWIFSLLVFILVETFL